MQVATYLYRCVTRLNEPFSEPQSSRLGDKLNLIPTVVICPQDGTAVLQRLIRLGLQSRLRTNLEIRVRHSL